jgi:hypothetical protein
LVSTARNVRTNADNARAEGFAEIVTTNDWLLRFTVAPPSGGAGLIDGWVMPSVLIEIFARINLSLFLAPSQIDVTDRDSK